jgi:hypothetical protein
MTRTMRSLIAAAALLGAMPAAANADTVEGVVVARDAGLGTVVVAGRAAATLRVARPASFKPGLKVRATATRLADGSYRATGIKRRGRAGAARLRFAVVRRAGREYLVTAGGSTFALRAGRGAGVSTPGAVVAARLRVAKGKVAVAKAKPAGQVATLELDGRFLALDGGMLRLAAGGSAPVAVAVPAGVEPALEAGDAVELLVGVGADGSLTLLAIDGALEAFGAITAVSATAISVGAVTCAVPEDLDVSDLVAGDVATLYCSLVDGVMTAEELELDDFGLDEDDFGFGDEEPYDDEIDPEGDDLEE